MRTGICSRHALLARLRDTTFDMTTLMMREKLTWTRVKFGRRSMRSEVRLYRRSQILSGSDRDDGSSRRGWITGGRGLLGTGLALAAFLAVVLTAVSVPGDDAVAQFPDPDAEVKKRAAAWWDLLTPDQRTNAIFGKEFDTIADTPARDLPESTSSDYDELTPTGARLVALDLLQVIISQALVDLFVNGNSNTQIVNDGIQDGRDIYAVGEHRDEVVSAIRGFQSVELWWEYLTCVEARIAVGEDNDDLQLIGNEAETSSVCVGTVNAAADGVDSTVKPYNQVKTIADRVGQAILGLDGPGRKSSAQNDRAEAWWNLMIEPVPGYLTELFVVNASLPDGSGIHSRRDRALYGYVDNNTPNIPAVRVDYDALTDDVKALVNDRWRWIYNGGIDDINSEGKPAIVYWWDSLSCAQKIVLQGIDNEPDAVNYGEECGTWDTITNPPAPPDAGDTAITRAAINISEETRTRFSYSNAVLGTTLPVAEAWWNLLGELPDITIDGVAYDRRVIAVYGNPPVPWIDPDGDPTTNDDPEPTLARTPPDDEKALFEKSYGELRGAIEVDGPDEQLSTRLAPFLVVELVEHRGVWGRTETTNTSKPLQGDIDGDGADEYYYSAKQIVDGLALMLFDPVEEPVVATGPPNYEFLFAAGTVRTWRPDTGWFYQNDAVSKSSASEIGYFDNYRFNWPYKSDNGPPSVADWWGTLDCRLKRMAVGEDNQYLNASYDANSDGDTDDEGEAAETSIYCGHFPGSAQAVADPSETLSVAVQKTVERVGTALLGFPANAPGRPSFNTEPTGTVTISGAAQVGSELTADADLMDADGAGDLYYQWFRTKNLIEESITEPRMSNSYTVQSDDAGAEIFVRASFTDGLRFVEEVDSGVTSTIAGRPGKISRIEPSIRRVTVSAGDKVVLSVDVYGRQDIKDNTLSASFKWTQDGAALVASGREITYAAPDSPGSYEIKATLGGGECRPRDDEALDDACTATIVVQVRRSSTGPAPAEPPQNPPGEIPSILTDGDGNQYEVFTPEGGGTFTGEGYSLTAGSGAVPNGEYIGIRVSDEGPASNVGMTHQRYTLGGNMYMVSAVDASDASISSYVLNSPATVCLPLPAELRSNISDLAIVALNADGSLTVLSATVRLGSAGTSVCGSLSSLPASLAVGSAGAPAAIPTATPEPEAEAPDTGGAAPSSGMGIWVLAMGSAVLFFGIGIFAALRRRRFVTKHQ